MLHLNVDKRYTSVSNLFSRLSGVIWVIDRKELWYKRAAEIRTTELHYVELCHSKRTLFSIYLEVLSVISLQNVKLSQLYSIFSFN